MRIKKMSLMMLMLVFMAGYAFAGAGHDHGEEKGSMKGSMKMEHSSTNAVEVGNKICPVSKEEIGSMGKPFRHEYKGKIYNLCCKMCLKDFKKNLKKFSTIAEEEAAENNHEKGGHQHKGSSHGDNKESHQEEDHSRHGH